MSLAEKLKTRDVSSNYTNSIDRWLEKLDGEERDAAEKMLRDPDNWTQRDIRWAFRDEGFRVSTATISDWRKFNGVTS